MSIGNEYIFRNFQVQFSNITQCVTVWTEIINKREKLSESELRNMKLYSIQNATIIFYIPLMILVACYVLILKVSLLFDRKNVK